MSEIKDGGPAFPLSRNPDSTWAKPKDGMTLRDYFAAKAMQGMLSGKLEVPIDWAEKISANAYHMADAMLTQRALIKK